MNQQRKKEIASHFVEALNKEDLHTSEAARFLNMNPCYLSMLKNEKHWDCMSGVSWNRLEEWHESRDTIRSFKIPEGEEIYKRPAKPVVAEKEPPEEFSPEATFSVPVKKKSHNGKNVKSVVSNAEISDLRKRILDIETSLMNEIRNVAKLETIVDELKAITDKQDQVIHDYGKEFFVLNDETISVMLARQKDHEKRIEGVEEGISHLVTIPKNGSGLTINFYNQ